MIDLPLPWPNWLPITAPAIPPPIAPTPELPSPGVVTSFTDSTVPKTPAGTAGCGACAMGAAAAICTGRVGCGFAARCTGLGFTTGVACGAAAGMEVSTAACGAGVAGVDAATTGSASLLDPREWGSRPVSAATPAAEKTVTEMAAAVSSG